MVLPPLLTILPPGAPILPILPMARTAPIGLPPTQQPENLPSPTFRRCPGTTPAPAAFSSPMLDTPVDFPFVTAPWGQITSILLGEAAARALSTTSLIGKAESMVFPRTVSVIYQMLHCLRRMPSGFTRSCSVCRTPQKEELPATIRYRWTCSTTAPAELPLRHLNLPVFRR